MEVEKALELINSIDFTESDADGVICNYVLIENNEDNRKIINEIINKSDKKTEDRFNNYLVDYLSSDTESIDIAPLAFVFGDWWDGESDQFLLEGPDDNF
ncbi:hypothetical protein RJD24_18740 [Bacillaceae bacterium IKA-2]|nr:hypothetical protein RJD24_18740 [Bacillaceae bacterium IKA-2]